MKYIKNLQIKGLSSNYLLLRHRCKFENVCLSIDNGVEIPIETNKIHRPWLSLKVKGSLSKVDNEQFVLESFLMKRKQDGEQHYFNGNTYATLTDLIEDNKAKGLSCSLVNKRLKNGLSLLEALQKPRCAGEITHPKRSKHYYDGKCYGSYKEMILDNMHPSLSYSAVYTRLRNGWSLTEALQSPKLEIVNNLNNVK